MSFPPHVHCPCLILSMLGFLLLKNSAGESDGTANRLLFTCVK